MAEIHLPESPQHKPSSVDEVRAHIAAVADCHITYEPDSCVERYCTLAFDAVDLLAEIELLRAVAEAAKKARGITGNYNQHTAACQDCPCDVCEDFFDLEQDAELELDAVLLALDRNKAN